ncbi:VOC family protein [Oricola sp.]|uniref:VOC family protein n=1 Tax=Oricola sp. TaxID=1979950 RepID=UPI0025D08E3C|nr:VOC family protein [Oricola sp.]MCI5075204.1 VOC family protein [Oricola sp.]
MSDYKPTGYTSAAPYLIVPDARKTLDFLKAVFGAEDLRLHRRDDGSVMHAEARIDDTVVMMGEMADGPKTNVHVYCADVEEAFQRALEAGGTVVQPLELKPDGDRRGGIDDGNNTVWWLARQEG